MHGGGFYHVEKYMVAPKTLPPDLVWFKWEAYLTWVTGFALLVVQYYWNANAFLIDRAVLPLLPIQAIVISVLSLAAGWFIYDRLCKSPIGENTPLLAVLLFVLIVVTAYIYTHVFSGRGALIHVGAFVGTIMAVNVFGVIIPNQKKITAALLAGRAPDPALGATGKQRSVHNNYLTLPVLLMMVSSHYPILLSHPHSWLIVALILVMGGTVRHFLNRHDAGDPLREDRLDAAGSRGRARRRDLPHRAAQRCGAVRTDRQRRRRPQHHRQALRHVPFDQAEPRGLRCAAERGGVRLPRRYPPARPAGPGADRERQCHAARQRDGNDRRRAPEAWRVAA